MHIIEQFIEGKTGEAAKCEDRIVVTPDFIAVLDGVTSRAGYSLGGYSTGIFATIVVEEEIKKLPADIDAETAVDRLTAALKTAAQKAADAEGKTFTDRWARPATALIMYSRNRREVWRVADSSVMIDNHLEMKTFPQEKIWCDLRHAHICSLLAKGVPEQDIRDNDPTWELLIPMIGEFWIFSNYDGPYGFGVINGNKVPCVHIEVFKADEAKQIILASDGYPGVLPTLAETEAHLKYIITHDPLMYKISPQAKGIKKGWVSYDDRSYIRFSV